MVMLELGPVRLRYEVRGDGPPILFLAPGGLRASRVETWSAAPWNPVDALADRYTVVTMDQRNTGTSFAPITAADGWPTYAADQLALMDHLGFDRFGVVGMCIGGAFIAELVSTVPQRIAAAVAMQPIGLDDNRTEFRAMFDQWREQIGGDHPEAGEEDWEGCWSNLFGRDDVLFSAADAELASVPTPLLVLRGNDVYHPSAASEHFVELVPGATMIERWKEPEHHPAAHAAVDEFFAAHLG
jgi:pimeloyl-ACP methyl ester carboxylesterase